MGSSFTQEDGLIVPWEQRKKSLAKTNQAIKDGIIAPPDQLGCKRCGQKLGIIHYHNHNYRDHIKFLEPLCWRCHMMIHSRYPESAKRYFAEVAAGKQYPPVYRPKKE